MSAPAQALVRPAHPSALAAMAAALGVFVARPLVPGGTAGLLLVFGALLVLGVAWPLEIEEPAALRKALLPLAAGVGAFALVRVLGGHAVTNQRPGYVAGIILAAVAEEAFFRRFLYAVLLPGGTALALCGSSALFAVAHVTVYGWWVLPLDLAAGLILGWQRWTTGSWAVPAITHVTANLLIIL